MAWHDKPCQLNDSSEQEPQRSGGVQLGSVPTRHALFNHGADEQKSSTSRNYGSLGLAQGPPRVTCTWTDAASGALRITKVVEHVLTVAPSTVTV